jgi:hypothetical protein
MHPKDVAIDHEDEFFFGGVLGPRANGRSVPKIDVSSPASHAVVPKINFKFFSSNTSFLTWSQFHHNAVLQTQAQTKRTTYSLCCMLPAVDFSLRCLLQFQTVCFFIAYVYQKRERVLPGDFPSSKCFPFPLIIKNVLPLTEPPPPLGLFSIAPFLSWSFNVKTTAGSTRKNLYH